MRIRKHDEFLLGVFNCFRVHVRFNLDDVNGQVAGFQQEIQSQLRIIFFYFIFYKLKNGSPDLTSVKFGLKFEMQTDFFQCSGEFVEKAKNLEKKGFLAFFWKTFLIGIRKCIFKFLTKVPYVLKVLLYVFGIIFTIDKVEVAI